MASIIVDEGDGPRQLQLPRDRTLVGSNPQCDVQLRHVTATGTRFVIDAAVQPARVTVLKGEVLLNDRVVLASDLRHNDTLRAGEATLLFLDPPEGGARAPASPAQADAADTLRALERLRDSLEPR
ncbi:MAG TPA: FHA domain-containing protein [Planctomycetota bacterium]|jgi:hypothetical protein|nr:FHA domain-containing protein [Planctomycetota bacterium]